MKDYRQSDAPVAQTWPVYDGEGLVYLLSFSKSFFFPSVCATLEDELGRLYREIEFVTVAYYDDLEKLPESAA